MAKQAISKGTRVDAVAPRPFWTAKQPSGGQPQDAVEKFGSEVPLGRSSQPVEFAPIYVFLAVLELAFASPLERWTFYGSEAFAIATEGLAGHVAYASPFAESGVYTYVRDAKLTLTGHRGSRPAQLIERLGAINQVGEEVHHPMLVGASRRSPNARLPSPIASMEKGDLRIGNEHQHPRRQRPDLRQFASRHERLAR